jgi:hypothetical protein
MSQPSNSFESFRDQALASGYDEALLREWAPHFANETHSHPFDTHALVARGEFWLTVGGLVQHFKTGDTFDVARGVEHAERYGPEGATFWAARRNPKV